MGLSRISWMSRGAFSKKCKLVSRTRNQSHASARPPEAPARADRRPPSLLRCRSRRLGSLSFHHRGPIAALLGHLKFEIVRGRRCGFHRVAAPYHFAFHFHFVGPRPDVAL